jgi:hypothetical protein
VARAEAGNMTASARLAIRETKDVIVISLAMRGFELQT